MRISFVFSRTTEISVACLIALAGARASAGDLEWSGVYRVEGNYINKPELDGSGSKKEYGLHHLVLRPKIVASDGLTIYSQFDIFNSPMSGDGRYGPNQLGQFFGENEVGGGASSTNNDSSSMSQTLEADTLQISQLYLTVNNEFGSLIVGRAPVHFGLGITHNAGRGLFDHWYDTRDLVGYKIVMGNMFFYPFFGKTKEGALNTSDDVTDYMFQLQYENPETDIEMGVLYWIRKSKAGGNDTPINATDNLYGGAGALKGEGVETKTVNVYALKDSESFRFGVEASFASGKTGVRTAAGEDVTLNSTGVAGELEFRPQASNWKFGMNFGYATGDDPTSTATFEGYAFDRNYDVAFLLFNHPLGQRDFFRTGIFGGGAGGSMDVVDTEAISNVMYLSPYFKYQWSDRYKLNGALTTGWMNEESLTGVGMSKDVGYEFDLSLVYAPKKGIEWVNQLGMLMPGSAFEGGSNNFDTAFTYGFVSKAAISF